MKTFICLSALMLISCFRKAPEESTGKTVDHVIFDSLLSKYVSDDGMVDYAGFEREKETFRMYLEMLAANPPTKNWSPEEKLSYWINAYNAFTIELIISHKPETSIKEITPVSIPFVVSPWQIDFIAIGNETYNLDDIEHGIIRKEFDEPRIHFALVCAAYSCPPLRGEAYRAGDLDRQLDDQAKRFLGDRNRNRIESDHIEISKLFQWYEDDFTEQGGVVAFINQFVSVPVNEGATITYLPYYWQLNSQSLPHPH